MGRRKPRELEPEKPGRVFAYGRASLGRQKITLEYQDTRLTGYFEFRFKPFGHEFVGYFADPATSGRMPFRQRDAGSKVFDELRPGDHLIVTRPDRAFRNLADAFTTLETWEKQGIAVHLVEYGVDTSTPAGKLMIAFMALWADVERRMISERTKDINVERRRQGLAVGFAPIGYKKLTKKIGRKDGKDIFERRLEFDHDELRICRRIYLLRENREQWMTIRDKFRQANIIHRGGNNEWQVSSLFNYARAYRRLLAAGKLPPGLGPHDQSASSPTSANTPCSPTPSHAPSDIPPSCST
jgi:DNA invertase Pin-like site-specific DNA recombinase